MKKEGKRYVPQFWDPEYIMYFTSTIFYLFISDLILMATHSFLSALPELTSYFKWEVFTQKSRLTFEFDKVEITNMVLF